MALITSISGIRGTIGGAPGENLTPVDIVKFTAAYGTWLKMKTLGRKVVIGRDARPSGAMVSAMVAGTLVGLGFEVIDLGISTTPTVEMAVDEYEAAGGIVLTASHNPVEWNALKLLNGKGEFVTKKDGNEILEIAANQLYKFSAVDRMGKITPVADAVEMHIRKILELDLVNPFAIEQANFKVVVDGVNSSGSLFVPQLLRALGVKDIIVLNEEPTGWFAHNPEPLAEHLTETCEAIRAHGAHMGIVVDPDVDRLAFIDENGNMIGEEYTLVAVADYVLRHQVGAVVSNLSSSRALEDLAARYGVRRYASAVGEVNVTELMKRFDAVVGGEGNGGIIYPPLHYGRDAMVGIALFLSHLAKMGQTVSALRASYPDYFMAKKKIELTPEIKVPELLKAFKQHHADKKVNDIDGVKVDFEQSWVHLRSSNTEPIIRIYTEAPSQAEADQLADDTIALLKTLI